MSRKDDKQIVYELLHQNPDGEHYPCFKVVNAKGELAPNYAFGREIGQKKCLEAEGIIVNDNKVDLKVYKWSYADNKRLLRIIKMERCFDERGDLPINLKRGILAQDSLYDFFSEIKV